MTNSGDYPPLPQMNKYKEAGQPRMGPLSSSSSGAVRSPASRDRRAVVEIYQGPQMMPDEAMLPMPPHDIPQSPNELLKRTRKLIGRWQTFLGLLKRRV